MLEVDRGIFSALNVDNDAMDAIRRTMGTACVISKVFLRSEDILSCIRHHIDKHFDHAGRLNRYLIFWLEEDFNKISTSLKSLYF